MEMDTCESIDDLGMLRSELASCAQHLRLLKRYWRTPADQRPEARPPGSIHAAKQRATLLHLLLAHLRRRLHLRVYHGVDVATRAAQAQLAAELGKRVAGDAWRARLEVILRDA